MRLSASTSGDRRYFSARLGWREHFDPREMEMLAAGAVPMLIPPDTVQGRKNRVMRYDISPYSTLEFYLSCILSREQFAEVLLQCVEVVRQMRRLYLDEKNLVLDFQWIYVLLSDRSLHFIYLPLSVSRPEIWTLAEFFRRLVRKASRSTYEQASFLDACLAWLDRPAPFALDEFADFVKASALEPAVQGAVPVPPPPPPAPPQHVYRPEPQPVQPLLQEPAPQGPSTTALDGGMAPGGTVVLGEPPEPPRPRFFLTRLSTGERVEILQSPFLVGTEAGSAAYCVTGNPAVSRRHAVFTLQDGQCLLTDQRSTNKTYVNDCALVPFQAQALADGDKIRLGNEGFTFSREG